jgi:hypothetical protein
MSALTSFILDRSTIPERTNISPLRCVRNARLAKTEDNNNKVIFLFFAYSLKKMYERKPSAITIISGLKENVKIVNSKKEKIRRRAEKKFCNE